MSHAKRTAHADLPALPNLRLHLGYRAALHEVVTWQPCSDRLGFEADDVAALLESRGLRRGRKILRDTYVVLPAVDRAVCGVVPEACVVAWLESQRWGDLRALDAIDDEVAA